MLHDISMDPRQLKAAGEWVEIDIDQPAPVMLKLAHGILRVGQGDARASFYEDGTCAYDSETDDVQGSA